MKRIFTKQEAQAIGDRLGIDFNVVSLEQFRLGLGVELEHGSEYAETNITNDDLVMTGKIAWAHLKEIPNYYDGLINMEKAMEQPAKS